MPNTREKLVELLEQQDGVCVKGKLCSECDNEDLYECYLYAKADHLIANGVTVQEWIPVTERLPEHGDVVLCFMKFGEQRILQWDNVSNWWLGYGHGDDWQKADVTHWCCLPQPPKGE